MGVQFLDTVTETANDMDERREAGEDEVEEDGSSPSLPPPPHGRPRQTRFQPDRMTTMMGGGAADIESAQSIRMRDGVPFDRRKLLQRTRSMARQSELRGRLDLRASGTRASVVGRDDLLAIREIHDLQREIDAAGDDDATAEGSASSDIAGEGSASSSKKRGGIGGIPFYAPPMQRQRWDESQSLPHVNWGDLFFDLFYVAAAYNLGNMLATSLTPALWRRGVLYFVAVFGPLFTVWNQKLVYDARYCVIDHAHRIIDVVRVCFLSLAVLHVKTFDLMSDPRSVETFSFTLGIFLESTVRLGLSVESMVRGQGDREAIRLSSRRTIRDSILPVSLLYLAAVITSGIAYFRPMSGGGDSTAVDSLSAAYNGTDYGVDKGHTRALAAGYDDYEAKSDAYNKGTGSEEVRFVLLDDLPIILCLAAYVIDQTIGLLKRSCLPKDVAVLKRRTIPLNFEFCIHRYGEWIMLMLGESILSLLVVETTEVRAYYGVVFLGLLTVILFQALHFESQPSRADEHAMKRNRESRALFGMLMQLYSMALIAFGLSYKLMLKGIHKSSAAYSSSARVVSGADDSHGRYMLRGSSRRVVATAAGVGGAVPALSPDDAPILEWGHHRQLGGGSVVASDRAVAALFCGALTLVLTSLALLTLTHKSLRANLDRCSPPPSLPPSGVDDERRRCVFPVVRRVRWPCVALIALKLALLAVASTLFLLTTDPGWISLGGLGVVAMEATTRILGWRVFANARERADADGDGGGLDRGALAQDDFVANP